jgi:hypothetical protein
MEPILFVMAILGCGEGDSPCEQVRLADSRYESQAECAAATEAELLRHDDLLYPAVVAQCRRAGEAPETLHPSDFELPEPERGLERRLRVRQASAEAPRIDRAR